MEIGKKIQFYRKANKLTQRELADFSKIDMRTIQYYEKGDIIPKPEQLERLAKVLPIGGENLLKPNISIETIGDVMAIIYALKEKTEVNILHEQNCDDGIDLSTVRIQFTNNEINTSLICISQIEEKNDYVDLESNEDNSNEDNKDLTKAKKLMADKNVTLYDIETNKELRKLIFEEISNDIKFKSQRATKRFLDKFITSLTQDELDKIKLTSDKTPLD